MTKNLKRVGVGVGVEKKGKILKFSQFHRQMEEKQKGSVSR